MVPEWLKKIENMRKWVQSLCAPLRPLIVKEINPNFSDKCNIEYDYIFLAQKNVGQEPILRESNECHLGIFEQN